MNPSLSACALELLASDDHREAGAALARALVLATELDEGRSKSCLLHWSRPSRQRPRDRRPGELVGAGRHRFSASVSSTLVATRSQASIVCIGNFALRDAGAVVDCGAVAGARGMSRK